MMPFSKSFLFWSKWKQDAVLLTAQSVHVMIILVLWSAVGFVILMYKWTGFQYLNFYAKKGARIVWILFRLDIQVSRSLLIEFK